MIAAPARSEWIIRSASLGTRDRQNASTHSPPPRYDAAAAGTGAGAAPGAYAVARRDGCSFPPTP